MEFSSAYEAKLLCVLRAHTPDAVHPVQVVPVTPIALLAPRRK